MNYRAVAQKARKAIQKNGSPCLIKRQGDETYNPETDEYDSEEITVNGFALQDSFAEEVVNGTSIQYGDIKLMAVFDEAPKQGDVLSFGGKELTVVSLPKVVSPDGVTVMYYEVQCR